ncbi:MAG: SDR family oxidoreductase [Cryomorphaceae bacterium]
MRILILGASGLVGGNCLKHFTAQGHACLGTHYTFETEETSYFNTLAPSENDLKMVEAFRPEAIVHCGALTWVDYCEEHPEESYEKTVKSTIKAVELANAFGARFVYLSTDYVFDGSKGFYTEEDPTNPLSVYGAHKLAAEEHVRTHLPDHLICRITNVYGDEIRGKNFIARLSAGMRKGGPMELTLPYDQYATPVNAWDVARAIHLLLSSAHRGIFHFAGTDYLNRIQLAQRVASYFGHEGVSMIPVLTSDLGQSAARPLLGGMNAAKFNQEFPDFRWSNVDDYLKQLNNTPQ